MTRNARYRRRHAKRQNPYGVLHAKDGYLRRTMCGLQTGDGIYACNGTRGPSGKRVNCSECWAVMKERGIV